MTTHQNRPQQAAVPAGDSPPKRPRRGVLNAIHFWIIRQHDITLIFLGFTFGVAIAVCAHVAGAYWPFAVPR